MPNLSGGAIPNEMPEDKARLFVQATYPDYSEEQPAELPMPGPADTQPSVGSATADTPAPTMESPQHLRPGELRAIIEKLPSKKSSLPDGIANEVLKMTSGVHLPYLENLFNACLVHAYHPAVFRFVVTQVIKKADKTTYKDVRNWRGISLESPTGKILEKIMADHVQELASAHNLVPPHQ